MNISVLLHGELVYKAQVERRSYHAFGDFFPCARVGSVDRMQDGVIAAASPSAQPRGIASAFAYYPAVDNRGVTVNPPIDASFINVDLELRSSEDLAPLRAHMGRRAMELHCGEIDGEYFLSVESLIDGNLATGALRCTDDLLAIAESLPAELRGLWDRCRSRRFDYGFDGGLEGRPFNVVIDVVRLQRMNALGIEVAITLYSYHPSSQDVDLASDQRST